MVREVTVMIGGRHTRYLEAGAGWPVLLIHAFPLSADMWRGQLERVPAGWRFIAPDLRGFRGRRSMRLEHDDDAAPVTMDDYAQDLGGLLDHLEIESAVIGGLSMGGYVTFAAFRLMPDRFTAMILADTRPQADTAEGRAARESMRELVRMQGAGAVASEMLPQLLAPSTPQEQPEVVAEARALIEANFAPGIAAALGALMDRPDSTPDLARISCPVLVLVGEQDAITPVAEAERLQQAIGRSRLTVVPRAGHLSNLERPHEFSQALADFLASNG